MSSSCEVGIIGAGGFGREVLQYCLDARAKGWPHRVVGFLDDEADALSAYELSVEVVGRASELERCAVRAFIVALGDPVARRHFAEQVTSVGGELVTVVHPTAYVAATAMVAPGVVVCPFALIGDYARVGANVALNVYSSIGHDSTIGENSVISPYAAVTGSVRLGSESFLGTHSTVAPGVSLGRRCSVAAGAVVKQGAADGSLLAGNPARGRVVVALD